MTQPAAADDRATVIQLSQDRPMILWMETIEQQRALRAASLEQARALRAAIPRQTSAGVADLMREEVQRLEAVADACRRRIDHLQGIVDA